ncbi:MAG: phage portal protein [Thiohalophilus sp.]|nr:phage portal protein [Thiohalophilus sp.]MDZ7804324.1 phage portal protein [Thiohalophilus sp.]
MRMHDVQPTRRNPWGFVIELLDPARLDHLLNKDLRNGNRIRLGIELNHAGRPVAYWLLKGERKGWVSLRDTHERVPAEDIIHWFDPERPEQLRAGTWMASGLLTIHQLEAYQEAAITAARAGASKMGFYTQQETGMGAQAMATDEGDDDQLYEEIRARPLQRTAKGLRLRGLRSQVSARSVRPVYQVH